MILNKKILKYLMFNPVSLIIILSACQITVPKDPEVMVRSMGAEPSSLNPIISATDGEATRVFSGYIYESLLELDNQTFEVIPWLAESWEISKNRMEFIFHLRKDVEWQDGVPFTADDVVYAAEKIMDPKVFAPDMRVAFADLDRVVKIDEHTVKFIWKKPYFKALVRSGSLHPIPKHIFDDGSDFNSHPANRYPIGTGPYKFKEWKTGRKIYLEANPDYWKGSPGIKGVLFKNVGDMSVVLHELKRGNFDIAGVTQIQWARQIDTPAIEKSFVKKRFFTPNFTYIGWSLKKPYFQDRNVRRALTMLIDRKLIIEKLVFDQARLTTGPFYIDEPSYDKNIQPIPYNPKAAARLLDRSGWIDHDGDGVRDKDGIKFSFTYLIPSGAKIYEKLASIMREDFGKVGIVVDVQRLEWASFLRQLNTREFDAVSLVWSLGIDPDMFQIWHSSQIAEGSNFIGYSNPEVDRLIEEARVEFDNQKRYEINRKIHKLIHDDQPYTFLFAGTSLMLRHKRFTNVVDYPLGWDIREWTIGDGAGDRSRRDLSP